MTVSENQFIFDRLAPPLQRFLWEQRWTGLRAAQAEALPLILDGRDDVIIASATASGKTEAAFLPLLTRLWQGEGRGTVLYVAPMKALINDQQERLNRMCAPLEIPVFPWHGDIGQTSRRRFFAEPRGLVLITPESLESLLFRRGMELDSLFDKLESVVVDELHAFIGSERGRQLQSLLHRLEEALDRRVPRIGLSATLGDMGMAADFLRPGAGAEVRMVAISDNSKPLQLAFKVVIQPDTVSEMQEAAHLAIAEELFTRLRDGNYLIFPNSTGMVEFYADALRRHCEADGLPVTFFPHHGRLSKSEREDTEESLKRGAIPVSAICTTTLEVGIDIGAIRGVVQIGAPEAVASLCQRVGRAGRRSGEAAVLRQYCVVEAQTADRGCVAGLYPDFLQGIAVIRLFLAKWYEPSSPGALHYSTLVQQLLSLIGERHGVTAATAFRVLCLRGPFRGVSEADFIELLRALSAGDLIFQDANRLLLHGALGEKRVNHFSFFAAFPDSQEYRLLHAGKELGTLPLNRRRGVGEVLIFAGRRWRIAEIDHDKRRVDMIPALAGRLPRTGGGVLPVHDRVREEMRAVLEDEDCPVWLDAQGKDLLGQARKNFAVSGLTKNSWVREGKNINFFSWRGDRTQDALVFLLRFHGLVADNRGVCVQVRDTSTTELRVSFEKIADLPCPDPADILDRPCLGNHEKWDWVLPDRLFYASYAASLLDFPAAHALCVDAKEINS